MSNNYVLKIDYEMAEYIFTKRLFPNKTIEYRKQNKSYIKQGDTITFVNIRCSVVYGAVTVEKVKLVFKEDLPLNKLEQMPNWVKGTYQFIETNYKDEQVLIEFHIKPKEAE